MSDTRIYLYAHSRQIARLSINKTISMKRIVLTICLCLYCFSAAFTQIIGHDVFGVQTNPREWPYGLITLDTLMNAQTLNDLNARYKSDWVATYHSVEIATKCAGQVEKAVGKNDTLTTAQIALLGRATADCGITITVDYIPDNKLKDNPARTMDFSLRIRPIREAKYPGGMAALNAYFEEKVIAEIPPHIQEQIEDARVRFFVNERGQVVEVSLLRATQNEQVDQLLVETVCNIPRWTPAEDSKGEPVVQEFEFRLGTALRKCGYMY